MSTQVQTTQQTARQFFESEAIQKHMKAVLGERSNQFRTTVLNIVTNTAALQKCEPASIYNCALVATTLNLPLNQNLGFAYIIPYGNQAQFQIGYKGFIQLAQRSGQFKRINSVPVFDTDTEEDVKKRLVSLLPSSSNGALIGYCAYFQLTNGHEHSLTMSVEELTKHGKKYSKSFNRLWTTDFESMARKTVLKLLLQRYAPMSIEMIKAETADQSVVKKVNEDDTIEVEYIDNSIKTHQDTSVEEEHERIKLFIENSTSEKELLDGLNNIELNEELQTLADLKIQSFK